MVRRIIRGTGKTLIAFGVLLFLFVAYQLWGTGLAERRDQKAMKSQLRELWQPIPAGEVAAPASAPQAVAVPEPIPGKAVALIRIPKIGVEKAVVEGVSVEDLKKGPGHYPDTPVPGEAGNAAIAGHRTTYGAPFYRLDEMEVGDAVFVRTRVAEFEYTVLEKKIVSPDEVSVLDPTTDNRLTLTTCHPRFSAAKRLIVVAQLKGEAIQPPAPPPEAAAAPAAPAPARASIDGGLSGVRVSKEPVIAWGVLAGTVWLGAWLLGRQWKRWPVYAMATPVFLVVLFMFYENVARLLPANV